MTALLRLFLPFIFGLAGTVLLAQPANTYAFKHISTENGLSNSTVECIFQDHTGLIWIGTRNGLNRIEGDHITTFYHKQDDTSSLSDDYVTGIAQDAQHRLWIGTRNGINILDLSSGIFHCFQPAGAQLPVIVNSLQYDGSGNIWVATANNGLLQMDTRTKKAVSAPGVQAACGNSLTVNTLYIDHDKNIWFSTPDGLFSYNIISHQGKKWFDGNLSHTGNIIKIICTAGHILVLGTEENGVLLFSTAGKTLERITQSGAESYRLSNNMIKSLWPDKDGTVWIGTLTGLDHLDAEKKIITHQYSKQDNDYSLSQKTVSAIFRDKESNLWVGTHRGGVNISYSRRSFFKTFRLQRDAGGLHYEDIKAFWEAPDGGIWTGTDGGGINMLNPQTGVFSYFVHDSSDVSSLSSNAVLDIYSDRQNNVWVATWGGGLNRYIPASRSFLHLTHKQGDPGTIPSDYVQRIYQDHEGLLWVGTYYGGLALLDPATGRFTPFDQTGVSRNAIWGHNVLSITEDDRERLWIGTDDGGLNCIDKKNKTTSHFFIDKNSSIPDLRVLFIDKQQTLWVGEKGLFRFEANKSKFVFFTTHTLLDNVIVKSIEQDNNGLLWISTSNGLFSLNLSGNNVQRFNVTDDLQSEEFEDNASLKTRAGLLYFGGLKGFNSFLPAQLIQQLKSPALLFTGLTIVDNPRAAINKVLILPGEVTLSYRDNSFSIDCANANYSDIGNHNIVYRLRGINNNWQQAAGNKISFNHLAPGTYTLEISSNAAGLSGFTGSKTILITIEPPYWQSTWFISLVVLILGSAGYWLIGTKRKREIAQLKIQKEREMAEMQAQMFTNLSHELRTPLTLISAPIENLMEQNTDPTLQKTYRSIQANTQKLQQLLKEILDFSKLKNEDTPLQVSAGNIGQMGSEITEYHQPLARQKNIRLHYKTNMENKQIFYDHSIVEKMMNNLLSNAIKYTPVGGEVTFTVFETTSLPKPYFQYSSAAGGYPEATTFVCISVRDNGIGISENSLPKIFQRYFRTSDRHIGAGIGLAFVKQLALKHKGSIIVSSEKDKGTEFILLLPAEQSAYGPQERKSADVPVFTYTELPELYDKALPQATGKPVEGRAEILIVEDNAEVRQLLKEILERDFDILLARNGSEALEVIRENMPQLVISDIMMPVMDGITFCREVREDPLTAHLPIILLTAKESDQSYLEGLETGADYYFVKPFNPQILKKTIERIFKKRAQWKERLLQEAHLSVQEVTHLHADQQLLQKIIDIIDREMEDPDFKVEDLSKEMNMSKTKLYLKIKQITGGSFIELVKDLKMKKAAMLMSTTTLSVSEIMDMVGIQSQSYFIKTFKSVYGKTPSEYFQKR